MEVKSFSNTYQAQSYKNQKQPSFNGLSSKLSKNVFEKSEVIKLYKKHRSKSKGKIGTLPANWVYAIPFEHRSQSIKNILQNFGEIFSELRKKKNNPFNKKPFNVQKIGLITNIDEHYAKTNNIEGIIIDNGCTEIMEHAKNKTARYVYKKTYSDQLAPLRILKETLKWKPSQIKNERLKGVFYSLQIVSDKNAKKCLDLLLPAADKEVSLYITQNIFYSPYNLRKEVFNAMYAKNDVKIDEMLTKRLEYIFGPIEQDTEAIKLLKSRNNKEINTLLKELYSV